MKKRIGIVTLQKSPVNYGAALQCYALWQHIASLGYDCEVLDIRRAGLKGFRYSKDYNEKKPRFVNFLKAKVKNFFVNLKYRERERVFTQFHNKIKYSRVYHSVQSLAKTPPVYDIYVTGSDQVWNPKMPFYNGTYFWEFAKKGGRKISYASSFSVDEIPQAMQQKYANWLNQYQSLSVREVAGQTIIKTLIGRDSMLVLDPVFLMNKEQWIGLEKMYNGIEKHFVFLYLVHYSPHFIGKAIQFARRVGLPLYVVLSGRLKIQAGEAIQVTDAGPQEWIYFINHADYVLSDSFHGTSMSLILRKPFISFVDRSKAVNGRIFTILESVSLMDHVVYLDSESDLQEMQFAYDETTVSEKLESLIANSKSYLYQALTD